MWKSRGVHGENGGESNKAWMSCIIQRELWFFVVNGQGQVRGRGTVRITS